VGGTCHEDGLTENCQLVSNWIPIDGKSRPGRQSYDQLLHTDWLQAVKVDIL